MMNACDGLDSYLSRRMTDDEAASFEGHIHTCARCRECLDRWAHFHRGLVSFVDDAATQPNEILARALVRRAEDERARSRLIYGWRAAALAGAVAAAAAVAVFVIWPRETAVDRAPAGRSASFEVLYPALSEPTAVSSAPDTLSATTDDGLLVAMGKGRFGLGAKARARVLKADEKDIRLELLGGSIGVDMPPAKKRASLSIRAGAFEVRVVGTRFWVSRPDAGGVEVGVVRGVVKVLSPDGRARELEAGEKLVASQAEEPEVGSLSSKDEVRLDSLLDPSKETLDSSEVQGNDQKPVLEELDDKAGADVRGTHRRAASSPSREEIERWILDGDFERADRALKAKIAAAPGDTSLLFLLATSQRKSKRPEDALSTLRDIVERGAPGERNTARFKAGVILQDQLGRHGEAVSQFDDYLGEPPGLRPNSVEARVRLARSLSRTGDEERYREVLRTIIKEHGGTDAAVEAGKQLKRIDGAAD